MTPVFGLEDVGGYGRSLAVYLIEKGFKVKEVNTALSYAERKSYPTTQKSDSWDAECVARILVNKLDILPDANPQDVYWTISQLVSRRYSLIKASMSLKNQLHAQLSHNYPSYKQFFSEIDGKCALEFWYQYPSPKKLKTVSAEKLTTFLQEASNNACSTKKAHEIIRIAECDGDTTREYQDQRDFLIQSYVRDLKFNKSEIQEVTDELRKMLKLLDYKLESMPGIETVTAAYLIAEIGDIKRFSNSHKLARFAGIAS
jgi:transposase